MFSALASVGVNILPIGTSILSLSYIIGVDEMDRAVEAIKAAFELR